MRLMYPSPLTLSFQLGTLEPVMTRTTMLSADATMDIKRYHRSGYGHLGKGMTSDPCTLAGLQSASRFFPAFPPELAWTSSLQLFFPSFPASFIPQLPRYPSTPIRLRRATPSTRQTCLHARESRTLRRRKSSRRCPAMKARRRKSKLPSL